jgi:hypothetical protein
MFSWFESLIDPLRKEKRLSAADSEAAAKARYG